MEREKRQSSQNTNAVVYRTAKIPHDPQLLPNLPSRHLVSECVSLNFNQDDDNIDAKECGHTVFLQNYAGICTGVEVLALDVVLVVYRNINVGQNGLKCDGDDVP